MSQSQRLIDGNKINIQLKSVNFNYSQPSKELLENIKEFETNIKDNYSILDIAEDHVKIIFERNVYFDPKALYDIEIKIILKYKLNEITDKDDDYLKKLKCEINDRIDDLMMPATIHSSVLVSQLTNVDSNDLPLVTAPIFISSTKDTK
ncbi:MAG: hypothetical protein KAX49_03330 [Halanaerobiales bacterium]|nr:hypothetical protein [Halanaerobiales bacterium]